MKVDALEIFIAVVELKNFSRAAELLHVTQPSVSVTIRNLENEFGTKLLHRSPKHVQVTEAGNMLYVHAKRIVSHYEEAKQEIHNLLHVVTGTLRIGTSFTIGEYILPKVLTEYVKQYPLVDIQVIISNTEEVIRGLESNQYDIGLIEGKTTHSHVEVTPFMQDEMIVVAPIHHHLSGFRIIDPLMLQDQVWVLREQGSGTRTYSDVFIEELHLKMKRFFIFSSIQGVKEAVMAGLGIALLSKWTVRKELEAGELCSLFLQNKRTYRSFSFVQNKQDYQSKATEMFIRKMEEFVIIH
ncbi:LysR family transcriptional regulator [Ectobacillus sp. sgz5001026]|uniref:LysR family transcriptional regulator n=1 Tax=Ectobacillus sp. sgz5001026 TaxID=3242473 RepID=UPI0036D2F95C